MLSHAPFYLSSNNPDISVNKARFVPFIQIRRETLRVTFLSEIRAQSRTEDCRPFGLPPPKAEDYPDSKLIRLLSLLFDSHPFSERV